MVQKQSYGRSYSEYLVKFEVPYKTEMGQSLCIVGSIQELGRWKEFKCHMKWNEGHVWSISGVKVPSSEEVFQYKYVVLNNNHPGRWEQGFNRIADLKLLAAQTGSNNVQLSDVFDRYTVDFSIYYPVQQTEYMRINGDPPELGLWNKG